MISKEWLSDFVAFGSRRDEDIAREFTLRVAEVESVVHEGELLENICVGVIEEVAPHPKADRLRLCSVAVGERAPVSVVCGGSNLVVGQKVALARVGARVRWHGEGELVMLEPAEIRGVKSDGMICGADEVGLAAEFPKGGEKEILDVSHLKVKAGTPLAAALGKNGVLFELDNKALSNRPDLWGLRGLAREFGAVLGVKVKLPEPKKIAGKSSVTLVVDVADNAACPRYQAVVVAGVAAVASPAWMQTRLVASGVRPITALVDVTNYVMLEGGQPLHAFDFDSIKDGEKRAHINVRAARAGEKIATLDGQTHDVPAGALMIATKKSAIAIAGVIGGTAHSISESTHTIVIESANFNAGSVRRTSTRLGVRTESSSRFEKGLDPCNTEWGLARAVELLAQLFPDAHVISSVVDVVKGALPKSRVIDLAQEDLDRAIGGGVAIHDAKKILEQLGFACTGTAKKIRVVVPTFRLKDVSGVHDLIEEVVRLHGYDALPATLPAIQLRNISEDPVVAQQFRIKQFCALQHGFTEVNTYAYVRPQVAALFGTATESMIQLANPLSSERPFLAPTLAMNLAEVVEKNQRACDTVAVFEIAKVFKSGEFVIDASKKTERSVPVQPVHLGLALSSKKRDGDGVNNFARVVETVQRVCHELGYAVTIGTSGVEGCESWWQSGAAGVVSCAGVAIGYVAVLNSTVQNKMGIENQTVCAEIDLTALLALPPVGQQYAVTPAFQSSVRDVAVVVAESTSAAELLSAARGSHPLVRHVEIFDIFRGASVGAGKKAVALHVMYRADDHTLVGDELDAAHAAVVGALEKKCGARVR